MAIDVPTFVATYPEFTDAPASLVAAKLAEAQSLVPLSINIWNAGGDPARDLTQQATFLYTAAFLFDSPYARNMARVMDPKTKREVNPYRDRLDTLKRTVTSGFRVL